MKDHARIDDEQIAERYVLGRLPPVEAERFEEHYLHCEACLERVEAAEGLHQGLGRVAAEEAAAVRTGWAAVLARWSRSRALPWVAALGLLVVVLLPSGYLIYERGELAQQLERSRSEAAQRDGRVQEGTARIDELETEVERLSDVASAERRRREELSRDLDALETREPRPVVNTPIVTLGPERSAGVEPSVRLTLPEDVAWVVLALEVEPPEASSYRVALENPADEVVWRGTGLVPDALGTVNLSVPTEILTPGVWSLRLETEPDAGSPAPAGRFAVRIRR